MTTPSRRRSARRLRITTCIVFATALAISVRTARAAPQITEFPIPSHNTTFGIAADRDGSVWFTTLGPTKTVGHVLPSGVVTEISIPTTAANLGGMIVGPDDNIWFAEWSGRGGPLPLNRIGRISRGGGNFREFAVPPPINPELQDHIPHTLVMGPDANVWFTAGSDALGRITPAGEVTLYILPAFPCPLFPAGPEPFGLTVGPDAALWIAASAGAVMRFSLATKQFETVLAQCGNTPVNLTFGPDGNLWVTDWNFSKLFRISVQTGETTAFTVFSSPFGILSTGGHLFVTRTRDGFHDIARINPSTGTVEASYQVPTPDSVPLRMVADPAGNIWLNEQNGFKIARLDNIAPCLSTITPTYQAGTLGLRVVLKSDALALWGAWLAFDETVVPMWTVPIPPVAPAVFFDAQIRGYPRIGTVGVLTILATAAGEVCGDWQTVDTGGIGSTRERLENLIKTTGLVRP